MTISKGADWGSEVARPDDLRVAADDAELARLVAEPDAPPVAVRSGDMFTTIGARPLGERATLLALPIDLVEVRLDGSEPVTAVAHVVARSPWLHGGWWRGDIAAVMNAEFVGAYDVAPRGHPNDGRVEIFRVATSLDVRQRLAIRRRMRSGTHLPHPAIEHRTTRAATLTFDAERVVVIDGEIAGRARSIDVRVRPDATVLYA